MSFTIGCLSEGKLFLTAPDGKETEVKSTFVDSLKDRLQSIKNRREWKMAGSGAQFARGGLPTAPGTFEVDCFQARFSALCASPEKGCILYAIDAGDVHGIFSYSVAEREEQRLIHGPSRRFSWLQAHTGGEEVAVAVTQEDGTGCLGLFKPGRGGGVREITEGDAIDAYPAWAPGEDRSLVYQSSGIARRNGAWVGLGPAVLHRLDLERGEMETVSHDESQDFLCPSFGPGGELYYIQRPYERVAKMKPHTMVLDVLLFPFRLLRAFFAFLNVFSMIFSGKPLKTAGGPKREGPDPKAVFLYGRWIHVQEQMGKNQPEESLSAVPRSWTLKRLARGADLKEAEALAHGVMAYTIAPDGTLYYSNGRGIFKLAKGSKAPEKVSSRKLVTCLFAAEV